jgi:hypothetical protein
MGEIEAVGSGGVGFGQGGNRAKIQGLSRVDR